MRKIYFSMLLLLAAAAVSAGGINDSPVASDNNTRELFAFVVSSNRSTWTRFDWKRLTTVAMFGFSDTKFVHHAHRHGVRVVSVANVDKDRLTDPAYRRRWVKKRLREAIGANLDGINVDFEEALPKDGDASASYTRLIRQLSRAFHRRIPGSKVSVDMAWSPDCIDGRCYDYAAIAKAADHIFVMSYDEQSQMWDSNECLARANSPLRPTVDGVREYLRLGVDPRKMILGLPWYGYVYPCLTLEGDDVCRIASVPFRGCNCSDAAGREYDYKMVMDMLERNATGGMKWDQVSATPFFNFINASDGRWHQVWFDNPRSLRIKCEMSRTVLGLGGVGMWAANFLDYDNATQVREMWDAISC